MHGQLSTPALTVSAYPTMRPDTHQHLLGMVGVACDLIAPVKAGVMQYDFAEKAESGMCDWMTGHTFLTSLWSG